MHRLLSILFIAVLTFTATPLQSVFAVTGGEFQAGNIIDDGNFFNGNTMTVGDIQGFLNSKVPNCDTNHAASNGNNPPFTCLKSYSQSTPTKGAESGLCGQVNGGTKSSAQIIHDVAQACGVNPKALIVLLEKEQSLVTDTWPWNIQYRSATGYGCPDTAACDSEYYGFFNQVFSAARQFKKYGRDSSLFRYRAFRDNYIQYNPNAGCGGTNVYIQNQATAGLYNYTPYQPNASALANLNGAGDACGAYGNRNFWKLYNDWFGPTTTSYARSSAYAQGACTNPGYGSDSVGRLYNPETRDYLFTTSAIEACLAIKSGYIWDGIRFANYAPSADTVPVYRLVNYTRHLFTSSVDLKNDYINNRGYRDEGIAFYAKNTSASPNIAVYCYVKDESVVYTSATGEGALLSSEGYTNAGLAFYTGQLPNDKVFIYRLSRGAHRIYTSDPHEKDVAQLFYGFNWEVGAEVKAQKTPGPELTPVYRISTGDRHFYTTNRGERDTAVVFYGYKSEGTEFYAYPTQVGGSIPNYRLTDPAGNRLFTASAIERDVAQSRYGYSDEGVGWYLMP